MSPRLTIEYSRAHASSLKTMTLKILLVDDNQFFFGGCQAVFSNDARCQSHL